MAVQLPWTADSGQVTADSEVFTADGGAIQGIGGSTGGGGTGPNTTSDYSYRITSAWNQKPLFMQLVSQVTGAFAEIRDAALNMTQSFDLDTATGWQLDQVGLWVGQPRVVQSVLLTGFFGFADDVVALPFGEQGNASIGGAWFNLGNASTGSTVLDDATYRTIIKARIARNQSNGTLADIENSLQYIFGANCQVTDNGDYSLSIHVSTPITLTEQALLNTFDLLPRPAGVSVTITYAT